MKIEPPNLWRVIGGKDVQMRCRIRGRVAGKRKGKRERRVARVGEAAMCVVDFGCAGNFGVECTLIFWNEG